MFHLPLLLAVFAAAAFAGDLSAADNPAPVRVVPSVDLKRYAGKWYEIARYPNRFQRGCSGDVTANYTLRPDGKITVLNQCRTEKGSTKSAKGTARVASEKGPNTKLRVSFFWPFYGNYWIMELDENYEWAVIGEPGRDYLWILSRKPKMDDTLYNSLLEKIRAQGYDTSRLVRTKQSEP
jgi:apolipoprotein D and lipocalin family protein